MDATIDAGHARASALATNDTTPAYFDDGVVPAVFAVSLGLDLLLRSIEESTPPGAMPKQATWRSCVVRLPMVLATRSTRPKEPGARSVVMSPTVNGYEFVGSFSRACHRGRIFETRHRHASVGKGQADPPGTDREFKGRPSLGQRSSFVGRRRRCSALNSVYRS
jgi:hypothetical protein